MLVVLLVPVGVLGGALGQTGGEDADRTEVKGKSTRSMHHTPLTENFGFYNFTQNLHLKRLIKIW